MPRRPPRPVRTSPGPKRAPAHGTPPRARRPASPKGAPRSSAGRPPYLRPPGSVFAAAMLCGGGRSERTTKRRGPGTRTFEESVGYAAMNILGINCFAHDTAAALLVNDEPVAFVEEERLNREKHTQ